LLLLLVLLLVIGDYNYEHEMFWVALATGLWSIAKAFEVATNMLVVIMEGSEK